MMGTGSPGGTEQMAAVRCDFLGCAVMVVMGVHYKAEWRKVSPSSTAWQGLLTPSPGPPARPAGMGIALQDRSHSASITRCEAVLLVSVVISTSFRPTSRAIGSIRASASVA
jgi:hypothetical protein